MYLLEMNQTLHISDEDVTMHEAKLMQHFKINHKRKKSFSKQILYKTPSSLNTITELKMLTLNVQNKIYITLNN